jgi:hypothetical protein
MVRNHRLVITPVCLILGRSCRFLLSWIELRNSSNKILEFQDLGADVWTSGPLINEGSFTGFFL